jgi:hypothetical protein
MARSRGTTLAIIFGASDFQHYSNLGSLPNLAASAARFEDYLLKTLAIPRANILSLFGAENQPGALIDQIRHFLEERLAALADVTDIIYYYCGHGGYLNEKEYFLALACSNKKVKEATVFKISYLVDIISSLTRDRRNLVILDACYSGGALGEFAALNDSDSASTIKDQIYSELQPLEISESNEHDDDEPFAPAEGTILFCAAGPKRWAKTPLEKTYSMFSGALIAALESGDRRQGPTLSLKRVSELVKEKIKDGFGTQGVEPQIHVPVQGRADILQTPYFPNPAFDPNAFSARLATAERRIQNFETRLAKAESSLNEVTQRHADTSNLRRQIEDVKTAVAQARLPSGPSRPGRDEFYKHSILMRTVRTLFTIAPLDVLTIFVATAMIKDRVSYARISELSTTPATIMNHGSMQILIFLLVIHSAFMFFALFALIFSERYGEGLANGERPLTRFAWKIALKISLPSVLMNSFLAVFLLVSLMLMPDVFLIELMSSTSHP